MAVFENTYFTFYSDLKKRVLCFFSNGMSKQEALLSQTDRSTRFVSQNLANCCITVCEQLVRQVQNKSK